MIPGGESTTMLKLLHEEKLMAPLREFDSAQLYQLSKASSTKQFLERTAGLSQTDAGSTASLARKLGAMPETEARFVDDLPRIRNRFM